MFWLGTLLACAFALFAIGVVGHGSWVLRHLRHPVAVTAATIAGGVLGVPCSLAVAFAQDVTGWSPYVVGLEVLTLIGLVILVFAMRRTRRSAASARRVLVVGAHPDDLELACGGSLARFVDLGHEVRAVVMSRGGRGGHSDSREQEAMAGAEMLDLHAVSVHDFTDTMMATEIDEMVRFIEIAVDLFKPDVILTHSANDQHQDHHAVHLATLRAGRRCPTILCFESPSVTKEFAPQYFVDIAEYVSVKVSAVKAHAGQMKKPYMTAERLRGSAVFRGAQAKIEHAEGFEVVRALSSGIGDL